MKIIYRSLIIWRVLSALYCVLIFATVIPIAALLQAWLDNSSFFVPPAFFFWIVLPTAFVTVCLGAILKSSSQNTIRQPCKIRLGLYRQEEILSILAKKMRMKTVTKKCWYGKERRKRLLRVFVFLIDEKTDYLRYADQCVEKVNEKTHFPSRFGLYDYGYRGRLQVFLYDEVPQSVLLSTAKTTEESIREPEFTVNLFVELNNGILYIPFCCSRVLGASMRYQYVIGRVAEWFDLTNASWGF